MCYDASMDPLLLLGGAGLLLLLFAGSNQANDQVGCTYGATPDQAELQRLCDEVRRVKARSWKGAERYYGDAERLAQNMGVLLPPDIYMIGARAAMLNRGDYTTAVARLDLAAQQSPEAKQELADLQTNVIGKVSLVGRKKLKRDPDPFVTEHKLAIEDAQRQISETGTFTGWLPKGTYRFGKKTFTV